MGSMADRPHRAASSLLFLLVAGCAAAKTGTPSLTASREWVLVEHLLADVDSVPLLRGGRLLVDPRWGIDDSLAIRRTEIALRSGHDTMTILSCPGPLVPDASKAGCPDVTVRIVRFGIILPPQRDSQTVQIGVDWSDVRPFGEARYGYHYTVRWDGHRWWTLTRKLFGIAE